jgi:ribosomal protein S18 acetylase RimI-like enzyme
MSIRFKLRDFCAEDTIPLNDVAVSAFEQFNREYSNWLAMRQRVSRMSELISGGQIVVGELNGRIAGGVAYIPPGKPKADYFDQTWPIIRMLVVHSSGRGRGLGRALTEECICRAKRDKAALIALHTTPIMKVALKMYLRMGFKFLRQAPPIFGVPYGVYTKALR